MKKLNIDWSNHFVAFISSLVGILIAFQLNDFQENAKEHERLKVALQAIKAEIKTNLEIYRYNKDTIGNWLEYEEFIVSHSKPEGLLVSESELDFVKLLHAKRFSNNKLLGKKNDTLYIYSNNQFTLNATPKVGISSNNWEAAKSSAVLNYLDQPRMAALVQIYNWIQRDIGEDELAIYKMLVRKRYLHLKMHAIADIY